MNDKKRIACIIVNYNGIKDTIETIDSLHNSSCSVDIVLVDNASDNDEGKRLASMFEDVVVLLSDRNLGFAGANNLGFKYALENDYEYILLLNNDTTVAENMIEELMAAAGQNIVVVPTMYYYFEPQKIWYAGGRFNRFTGAAKHLTNDAAARIDFATGCCMLMSSQTVKEIGGLDEEYFMYCEDADYSIRLLENNKKLIHVPTAHLWHKVGSSSDTISNLALYYYSRNRLFLTGSHRSFFHFTAFPVSLLTRYIRLLQAYIHKDEKWKVYRKAISDYFHNVRGKADSFT